MSTSKSSILINAPIEKVFQTISIPENYCNAIPDVKKIEIISDIKKGVGTKFRETRKMNGKDVVTTLEVVEFEENKFIRLTSDAGGTVWNSTFKVKQIGEQVELSLQMKAKPYKFLAKLMTRVVKGFIQKALDNDMKSVKKYCEAK